MPLQANMALLKAFGRAAWTGAQDLAKTNTGRGMAIGAGTGFVAAEAGGGRHKFRDTLAGGMLGAAGGRAFTHMGAGSFAERMTNLKAGAKGDWADKGKAWGAARSAMSDRFSFSGSADGTGA
jgi:hypothetical protein